MGFRVRVRVRVSVSVRVSVRVKLSVRVSVSADRALVDVHALSAILIDVGETVPGLGFRVRVSAFESITTATGSAAKAYSYCDG